MASVFRWLGIGVLVVLVLLAGLLIWSGVAASNSLARTWEVHEVDFPIPFPLSEEERVELGVLEDSAADRLARERAIERGRHLVEARYPCAGCHGEDLGGGVMVDAFPLATFLGPNLTAGEGGVTHDYRAADWDRIVRHGLLPDGRNAVMPSEDFLRMSDRELSDIVTYLQSLEPVDATVPAPSLGPLGKVLVATGQMRWSAELIGEHFADHPVDAPDAEVSVAFGEHLAGVCTGCHGPELTGGPISGGDPAWGPASNLTPHADGLAGWSYQDFRRAMIEGVRPDGTELVEPMTFIQPIADRMTDVEMEALWTYLSSLAPQPTGR